MSELVLVLPFPPSVNRYYRNVVIGGRPRTLVSKDGRAFRATVEDICAIRRVSMLRGRVRVEVDVHAPDRRKRDLDNVLKSLLDALVHGGVLGDDEQIDHLVVRRGERDSVGFVRVAVSLLSGTQEETKECT